MTGSGKEWHRVRSLVQQDMMRPKSALFYIDDLSQLMDDLIIKIDGMLDHNKEADITESMSEFALDAVGIMFIGSNLGVLKGSEYGKQMMEKVQQFFELSQLCLAFPPKIAPYIPTYKRFVQVGADIFTMSREKIDEAIKKHEQDGSLEGTILEKMIARCGSDSDIPTVMANDALLAGVDTTGNTAAFLIYHLSTNPDKQEKLYEEIVNVIGTDGKMTERALTEMRYLKACQTESARILPVIDGTTRYSYIRCTFAYQIYQM